MLRRRRAIPRRQLTTVQKGYGADHKRLRRAVKRAVDAGRAVCWRCGRLISPHEPWDLGHDDHRLAKHLGMYRGPEHRRCSRTAGALKRQGLQMPRQVEQRRRPRKIGYFGVEPEPEPEAGEGVSNASGT